MTSSALLVLAAAAMVAGAAADHGMPSGSASGDGGDPVAVGDSWLVRFEYDLGSASGCYSPQPNFVEATQGCYTTEGPIASCTIEYGRTGNSTEDVELTYFSSECSTDVASAIYKAFNDGGCFHPPGLLPRRRLRDGGVHQRLFCRQSVPCGRETRRER